MPSKAFDAVMQIIRERVSPEPQSIEEMRDEFEVNAKMFNVPEDVRCVPTRVNGLGAEWLVPSGVEDRVILYLHGGGYVMGSIATHREMAARIAHAAAASALLVDYRLAPEHPFPAAVEDAVASSRWLRKEGWAPSQTTVAGDSAGGGLTIATLVRLRDEGDPLPAAAVCLSPWVDMEGIGGSASTKADEDVIVQPEGIRFMAETYLAGQDPRTPLAAPLYAELDGLPPVLIQVGTSEVLLDDANRLAERARSADVEVTLERWEGMFHVWHWFASILPEGQEAIERVGAFIRRHS
jgi:monoterpene epsilon-lactone hydrolase